MAGGSVLLVGGGLTSALTASLLAEAAPGVAVTVWEKARGAGGRFATSRAPSEPACTVDLGAQYLSPSAEELQGAQYQHLLAAGLLAPLDLAQVRGHRHPAASQHFVAPAGTSSLVKHLLATAGAQCSFGRRVEGVVATAGGRWRVRAEGGEEEEYDAVVLTTPVPQLLQLGGDLPSLLEEQGVVEHLAKVSYSTRFVLGLFFNRPVELGTGWAVSYLDSHPVLRYVAVDSSKRGRAEGPTSVVMHTTVPWGQANTHLSLQQAEVELSREVRELFPSWPEPQERKVLKWLYSQV